MENNVIKNEVANTTPEATFTHKIGKTTYVVGVHFSKTSKETINDKIERLILNDLQREKYI
ncbi:MAG: transposon-encoded TnpW family protein [Brevinema sp.]